MCYGSEANNNLYCSSTLTSLAILLGHWLMAYNTGYICKLKIFSFILTELHGHPCSTQFPLLHKPLGWI